MANINTTLNDVFKSTALGDMRSSVGAALYGINHRQTPNTVPINQDGYGLTLMTRPQLNLSTDNLRQMRGLIPLTTTDELSIPRMVRCLLDPRLNLVCPIVDKKNAFIPILTNHMLSNTGWPDPYVEVHTSRPGVYKEEFSMVDSVIGSFAAYNISTTFRNMSGDPITLLLYTWIQYMAAVFRGDMSPYPDFIAYNEIDYNTRIYRLVLDRSKQYVQKIACCGAAFPKTVPLGAAFNFESGTPINASNDQISVEFQANGWNYQDEILIYEFNRTVELFNPDMADAVIYDRMVKLQPVQLSLFNNRGYPRIDYDTKELGWFVTLSEYNAIMSAYVRNASALGQSDSITDEAAAII